jgi:hypothetical protein
MVARIASTVVSLASVDHPIEQQGREQRGAVQARPRLVAWT